MASSRSDWERTIRRVARDSSHIRWTEHAKQQMRKRVITMAVVLDVLRNGVINREPELDLKTGDMHCRVERFCAGVPVAVVVALKCIRANECNVVTVFLIGE